jgi:acyl carrier protein
MTGARVDARVDDVVDDLAGGPGSTPGFAAIPPAGGAAVGYLLATTPTTVGQYWAYLCATGLARTPRPDLHGFPARPGSGLSADGRGVITPDPGGAALPVTYVSWHGALAYCAWLSAEVGAPCRLPTAGEWQAAAGGPEGYRWALGPDFVRDDYVTSAPGPQAVGLGKPNGYGLFDVTGQVFEWTSDARDGDGAPDVTPSRVVKGGSFILRNPENFENRATFTVDELSCLACVGFRVLCETPGVDAVVAGIVRRHLRKPVDAEATGDWAHLPLMELGFDSMAAIELVVDIEETLDVRFPDEVLVRETFRTLDTLTAVVRRL